MYIPDYLRLAISKVRQQTGIYSVTRIIQALDSCETLSFHMYGQKANPAEKMSVFKENGYVWMEPKICITPSDCHFYLPKCDAKIK